MRKNMRNRFLSISLVALLLTTSISQMACSNTASRYIQTAIASVESAIPLAEQYFPIAKPELEAALAVLQQASKDLANGIPTDVSGILNEAANVISDVEGVASGVLGAFLGPATTGIILGALAGANIALHALADLLAPSIPPTLKQRNNQDYAVIRAFQAQPVWGLHYR
jgi:hypothetical protein